MQNNNFICQFCLQNISVNNHKWNCEMNPVNMNNNEFQNKNRIEYSTVERIPHCHISWLEKGIDNFKKQNEKTHMIDGDMTFQEFLLKWCKNELSKIIKC